MTASLTAFSDTLAGVVEAAGPSVVRVSGGRRPGSGMIWSAEGVVLAAERLLRRDEDISVTLADGRELPATVAGRDPSTDLALLRVQATGLPVLRWREAGGLKVGQLALALGRPGRTVRARLGILSAVGEGWQAPGGSRIERYIEADIEPAFGISGGPLLDAVGEVIGVNTAGLRRGLVLTIPTATVRRIADGLLTHGRIRRGYLGVAAQTVPVPPALEQTVHQRAGLLVHAVEPGSPAERAGVLIGDLVLSIGGRPVHRSDQLMGLLTEDRIGATESVQLVRAGQVRDVQVTIGDRPAAA
ncbi:MAG TPA: trypsin-like peptidase domain-containing protein [bacterium]|nr:trypsin-like peptidase domain-containing protein [bacterium]